MASDHRQISDTFLRQAILEYREGDMLQASEKAWGAVAHYVKAMADDRGLSCGHHKQIEDNIYVLVGKDDYSRRLYNSVNNLHVNFYQDRQTPENVWLGIKDAVELVDRLKRREQEDKFVPATEGDLQ